MSANTMRRLHLGAAGDSCDTAVGLNVGEGLIDDEVTLACGEALVEFPQAFLAQ